MKTIIEIQYNEVDVKDVNIEKFVKEDLKNKGVKTADVKELEIYYIPVTLEIHYVAKTANDDIKGTLSANDVPEYKDEPVKKATKKAAPKKAAPKKATKAAPKAEKKPVAKKATKPAPKAATKPVVKAEPKVAPKAPAKPVVKVAPKAAPKKVETKKVETKKTVKAK